MYRPRIFFIVAALFTGLIFGFGALAAMISLDFEPERAAAIASLYAGLASFSTYSAGIIARIIDKRIEQRQPQLPRITCPAQGTQIQQTTRREVKHYVQNN